MVYEPCHSLVCTESSHLLVAKNETFKYGFTVLSFVDLNPYK